MAYDEEVEDLGDLESMLPASSGAKDAGEGSVATPALTCAGEDPVPTIEDTSLACASEDPVPAAAPTGEDTSVVAVGPAAEDPAASTDPSQVVGWGLGLSDVGFCFCYTKTRLLRRF
jgi:hypothetical protein